MDKINIKELLSHEKLSDEEKIFLFDELYWVDWQDLDQSPDLVERALELMREDGLSLEAMSRILPLYNNPEGAHTEEFAQITIDLYKKDPVRFFKALALNSEEAINLVYIFRNFSPFEDGDKELEEIRKKANFSHEEDESAETFFSMYKNVCNT